MRRSPGGWRQREADRYQGWVVCLGAASNDDVCLGAASNDDVCLGAASNDDVCLGAASNDDRPSPVRPGSHQRQAGQ
jgi:hypothetical protein